MYNLPVYAEKMTRSTTACFSLWLSWYLIILPAINSKEVTIQGGHMGNWSEEDKKSLKFSLPKSKGPIGESWVYKKPGQEFFTCGTGVEADFWFTTKPIYWSKTFPEVIHMDIEAETTMCFARTILQCFSNNFEIYIYPGKYEKTFSGQNPPSVTDVEDFRPLYNIANNASPNATLIRSNQTFSFHSQNFSNVVTFGIRSRGACGTIFRMRMYYYYCEEAFIKSIKFEETASPDTGSETTVKGNCSENAVTSTNDTNPKGKCTYNGTWNVNENVACMCVEKFALDRRKGICSALLILNEKPNVARIAYGVNITWREPNNRHDESILYDVNCFICNKNVTICTTPCTNETYNPRQLDLNVSWVIVSKLTVDATYMFRVYAKNHLNENVPKKEWTYKETYPVVVKSVPDTTTRPPTTRNGSSITTSRPTDKSTSDDNDWIMYIIIGVAAMVLFILIILLIIYVRRRKENRFKKSTDGRVNQAVELPAVGRRTYVDPSNYDDPEAAVQEFASELDPAMLFLERMIGGGEFGDVYKGELTTADKKKIPIAAKTLKHDADAKSKKDFMLEASVMGQFNNPNIVRLEGVITKSTPRMIILEFMSNGSLDNYLKSNDGMMTNLQLMGMARGVAAGMKYLAEIHFVHRDLAARNILVNDDLLCKIADFGLSRGLEVNDTSRAEYSTKGGKIPVRWTAPEAIKFRKFSTASDVWSFGILLWEIMSFAERPYWEWDNMTVVDKVDQGYRLPPPLNCPKGVHDLMLQCWNAERSERPSFARITIVIDKWIRSPETMNDKIGLSSPIGEWLDSIKMNSYETNFVEAGYKSKSEITELTDEDLITIGIPLIGHRNKIMKGINALKRKKVKRQTSVKI